MKNREPRCQFLVDYGQARAHAIRLFHMPPSLAAPDLGDISAVYPKLNGKLGARLFAGTDAPDRLGRELRHPVLRSSVLVPAVASLGVPVSRVIQIRAEEKMGWPYAVTDVAFVQNA